MIILKSLGLTDIVDAQRAGLVVLALIIAVAHVAGVLPPLAVEHLDNALLL